MQLQHHLGHSRASATADVYVHLFESHDDDLMERLDVQLRESARNPVGKLWATQRVVGLN
jgi:hypothetical protein